MLTRKQLLREAAGARAKAQKLLEYAEAMEVAAGQLPSSNDSGIVTKMESTTVTQERRRGPEPLKGPVKDLARALGVTTLEKVARALGVTYGNARVMNFRQKIPGKYTAKVEALKKAAADAKKTAE